VDVENKYQARLGLVGGCGLKPTQGQV